MAEQLRQYGPEAAGALGGADRVRSRRVAAAERFESQPLPTEADEIWRYSRIGQLDLDRYSPVEHPVPCLTGAVPPAVLPAIEAAGARSALVVVHNGAVVHVELPEAGSRGLVVGDLLEPPGDDDVLGTVAGEGGGDAFTDLNTAFATSGVSIEVSAGVELEAPVVVVHWVDHDRGAVFPRTVVRAGRDSGVTVVERLLSADVDALVVPVVEIEAGDAARVQYLNVQELGPRAWQVAYQASRVERDATLRSATVSLGGDYARVRTDSRITGKGGTSYLTAVYFADGGRMHDFRTIQDHVAPATTSDLLFKGAVQDTGRSVYSGLIRVAKEARGTNAFQTNRNLVLSEGAGAESVPNLEIETDDVRCSHASSVGPIDEEHRYYLESRGVPPEVAERLIVLGFFGEVLDRLPTPALVGAIRTTVAERLVARLAAADQA